jgi:quercetin dioxygenase-like cupin family protein
MATHVAPNAQYLLSPGEGTPMSWFQATLTLKASTPALGVVEVSIAPGDEPPLHVHSREDEWFYVLDGAATFHVGPDAYSGRPGAFVALPKGIPHTFTVESPQARFLLLNAPGGFERVFELAPKTIDEAVAALRTYGVDVVGPHPRDKASA